ncbi:MAG: ModE family transcriptional regulator [Pusillimonas sp.]|jgi:molybdate transport system regulatory protein|nr:ModE family transcriptional regulator [Pusillimonas sp.]
MSNPSPLRLDAALGHDIADKRIDVLRRIDAVGSISEAARDAGISYKAAWQAIETLGNLAGTPLVEKAVGGSGGGGAQLTTAGRQVLEAFDYFAQVRQVAMQQASATGHVTAFGLRTSMRNQWVCRVRELAPGAHGQMVTLALSDGTLMQALVTHESAQLLGLEPGLTVLALCKATAVPVQSEPPVEDTENVLAGQVEVVTVSSGKAEISMRLGCGAILVGFQNGGQAFAVGQPAWARVDPAAVVVALP